MLSGALAAGLTRSPTGRSRIMRWQSALFANPVCGLMRPRTAARHRPFDTFVFVVALHPCHEWAIAAPGWILPVLLPAEGCQVQVVVRAEEEIDAARVRISPRSSVAVAFSAVSSRTAATRS